MGLYHMINGKSVKKIRTGNGELKTGINFFTCATDDSLDGRDTTAELVYTTRGEVYNPSSKDIEIASMRKVEAKMTLKIRDPLKQYRPSNADFVEILDSRIKGKLGIIDVRPDFNDRKFLIIVAGG